MKGRFVGTARIAIDGVATYVAPTLICEEKGRDLRRSYIGLAISGVATYIAPA